MKFTYNNIPTEKLSGPLFIVSTPSSLEVFDNETEAKAVAATHFSANNGKSPVLVYALKHVVKPVVPEVKFEAAKQE